MIIKNIGDIFEYEGFKYEIGDRVIGTDQSEYEGLLGVITEIRTGEDKDTENETPDIYCCFDPPVLPYDIRELEERFMKLYGEQKTLDDISLDEVIIAPEMIETMRNLSEQQKSVNIYLVEEDWTVDGEHEHSSVPCMDDESAKRILREKLSKQKSGGCISMWENNKRFVDDSGYDFYECWLDGIYNQYHYKVEIEMETLFMSEQEWEDFGQNYLKEMFKKDFVSQIEKTGIEKLLTGRTYYKLINDPTIPKRVHSLLKQNNNYWESYRNSISDVVNDLIEEYQEREEQDSCFTPGPDNLFCIGKGHIVCKKCCKYKDMDNKGGCDE